MSSQISDERATTQKLWELLSRPAPKKSLWQRLVRRVRHDRRRRQIARATAALGAIGVVCAVPSYRGLFELPLANQMAPRMLMGEYEATQRILFEHLIRPNDQVIDVGANVGLYTVLAAQLAGPAGKVLAIEPVPAMLNLLHANVRRNYLQQVAIFEGVATDREQECQIHTVAGAEEYSSLRTIAHPNRPQGEEIKVTVQGLTLDQLAERYRIAPRLVKVDTEGAEGLVYSGSRETLKKFRPYVLSELDDRLLAGFGWSSGRVVRVLEEVGYHVFDQKNLQRLDERSQNFVGDILGIPAEFSTKDSSPSA